MLLILADARMPKKALNRLEQYGELIPFATKGLTYDAISGHPDIFFCNTPDGLVYAPNTPSENIGILQNRGLSLLPGKQPAGSKYPGSARYNAFVNHTYCIHNPGITDPTLLEHLKGVSHIEVKQGYTRCNLAEAGNLFITGDLGIKRVLQQNALDTFWVDQTNIQLQGFSHGFFGGCTGMLDNYFFVCGSIDSLPNGNILRRELEQRGINIISLYDGPLWDAGSILFLKL